MLLLTWHGTILRVEPSRSRLTHAPLHPVRPAGADFTFTPPPEGLTAPLEHESGLTLIPGPRPRTVHAVRGGNHLRVDPAQPFPTFDSAEPSPAETFLALAEHEAVLLRGLLSAECQVESAAAEPLGVALAPGFRLIIGSHEIDLTEATPQRIGPNLVAVTLPSGSLDIRLKPPAPQPRDIHLRRTPPAPLPDAASPEEFRATPNTVLSFPPTEEFYLPPLTTSFSDREWLIDRTWPAPPHYGRGTYRTRFAHHANAAVLMQRGVEGMVIDAAGVRSESGYLDQLPRPLPDHFAQEGNELFLCGAGLMTAPSLHGPHAVFYGGHLHDHFHWLIDSIVPLCALLPHLPQQTTLLLPATLGLGPETGLPGPHEVLKSFGLHEMKRAYIEAPLCLVDDLYRPEHSFLHQLPAQVLLDARDRALSALPPRGAARRRLFLRPRPPRGITNLAVIEALATEQGLEIVSLDGMSFADQIALFHDAALIVAVHGAELANLLFCRAGTAVIELSPDAQHRQHLVRLSNKLDLVHAILPCPTRDSRFDSSLAVPAVRLRAMLNLVRLRAGLAEEAA